MFSEAEDIKVRKGWSMLASSALTAKSQSEVFIFKNLYIPIHDDLQYRKHTEDQHQEIILI